MWSRERNKKRKVLGTDQKLLGKEVGSEKGRGEQKVFCFFTYIFIPLIFFICKYENNENLKI